MSEGRPIQWNEILSGEVLLSKLQNDEDDFIERKPHRKYHQFLETVVAFANSAPVGAPAILFAGADDKSRAGQINLQELETESKNITEYLKRSVYPPAYWWCVNLHTSNGKGCVAIVTLGSENRPHFAGQAYIRHGPQTKAASPEQFEALIASRNSKVREILKYIGKAVTCRSFATSDFRKWKLSNWNVSGSGVEPGIIVDCSRWFVTLRHAKIDSSTVSYPLDSLEISYDNSENRLELLIRQ